MKTYNSRGIACGRGGDKIGSLLAPVVGPLTVANAVVDKEDGTYGVSFVLSLDPGEYLLSINVNGCNIRGSPFTVPLKPRTLYRNLSPNIIQLDRTNGPSSYIKLPQQSVDFHGIAVSKKGTIFVCDAVLDCGKDPCFQ